MSDILGKPNSPEMIDPYRYWVAVIGMGAGGASLVSALIDRLILLDMRDTVGILMFDSKPENEFGRGIAWGSIQHDLFLANMRTHPQSLNLP